jgi:hypothetical protein
MSKEYRVRPSPSEALAMTNSLFVNPQDVTTPYVRMGPNIYKCIPHPQVEAGTVCMNAIARRSLGYGAEKVTLHDFVPTSVPTVKKLVVRAEPVKRDPLFVVAPTDLVNIIRNNLYGNVVCFDQKFTFMAGDHAILVTVTDADSQGFVDLSTEVNMMWSKNV